MKQQNLFLLNAFLLILAVSPASNAQQNSAGAISNYSREQNEQKQIRSNNLRKFKQEKLKPIYPQEHKQVSEDLDKKIYIKKINIEDATLLSKPYLKRIAKHYENKTVSFADLQELANKLSKLYRNAGYVTSFVYIPKQNTSKGNITLKAFEGRQKIEIKDGKYFKKRAFAKAIHLNQKAHLDIDQIAAEVRKINLNPDINLTAKLEKDNEIGYTKVVLEPNDTYPWHVSLLYDNLGRESIGRQRLGVKFMHNNLTTLGDHFVFEPSINTDFSLNLFANYELPIIKSWGTSVGIIAGHDQLFLNGVRALDQLGLRGYTTFLTPYIKQNFLHNKHFEGDAFLHLDIKDTRTDSDALAIKRLNEDKLRVIRPAINLTERDEYGLTNIRQDLSLGFEGFLGTDINRGLIDSRSGASENFVKYNIQASRLQKLPWGMSSIHRVTGQIASDSLPTIEQYQLGGAYSVRGYDEGSIIGDGGFMVSNELRMPLYFLPRDFGITTNKSGYPISWATRDKQAFGKYTFRDNINLALFSDFGGTFSKSIARLPSQENYLASIGAGLRVNLTRFINARFDVGLPLVQNNTSGQDIGLHFGIDTKLF